MSWKTTIDSVAKLELLYFFHNNPSTMDSAASLAVWAGIERQEAEAALRALAAAGLVRQSGEIFHYAPAPELEPLVRGAVEAYRSHRSVLRAELQRVERERGELRRSLRAEQNRGEAVLESVSEGILLLSASGDVEPLNARGRELLAKTGSGPMGELPWVVQEAFTAAQRRPGELVELAAGEIVLRVRATSLLRDPAEPASAAQVLTLYDVTREAEAERLKADLTRMITHDLRSPVSGISTAFELLLRDAEALGQRQRHIAEVGRRSAAYILGLVNNLLDIGRLEDGRMQLSRGAYHLEELLEAALAPLEGLLEERKLGVARRHPESRRTRVWADCELMVRVLGNLLANAAKFSEPDSELVLDCGEEGGEAYASIRDFGEGIPEAELSRVFEKYYRVAGGKASQVGGTGLGLYFVRLAVESHGGRVLVQNCVSSGCQFTVWLPTKPG